MAAFRGSGSWIREVAACTLLIRYTRENFKIATFSRLSQENKNLKNFWKHLYCMIRQWRIIRKPAKNRIFYWYIFQRKILLRYPETHRAGSFRGSQKILVGFQIIRHWRTMWYFSKISESQYFFSNLNSKVCTGLQINMLKCFCIFVS